MTKIKILFIAGSSRSGSTLLEIILSKINKFHPIGEIYQVWKGDTTNKVLCSCGLPFNQCKFWQKKKIYNLKYQKMEKIRKTLEKNFYIPFWFFDSLRTNTYKRYLKEYVYCMKKILVMRLEQKNKNKILIDSSKEPIRGMIVSSIPKIEMYCLHCIRDSRAVAYSWQRTKTFGVPLNKKRILKRRPLIKSSLMWTRRNLTAQLLKKRCKTYTTLRYEDLIANPKKELLRVMNELGFNITKKDLSFIKNNSLEPNGLHTIGGNPMKFQKGPIKLKLDDEWKTKMPWYKKAIVTALTFPLLLKYKYI